MSSIYPLLSVIGLEIEYMLVDKDTLDIAPKTDVILQALAGDLVNEFSLGDINISNEVVLHVLELKNNGPKPCNHLIAKQFYEALVKLQPVLDSLNVQFLPTAAHPWMNPLLETKRWPNDTLGIYKQFDSIFNCEGHGWANLQSMHVNLPFSNDAEFSILHNSIRLLLPLLPALAGSSPFLDGKRTGLLDSRLYYYERNQKRIPQITGDVIPEFMTTEAEYKNTILKPMYEAIRPYDKEGILQFEWLNSRGAMPKFNHKAIEIRIVDSQECPNADFAIASVIYAILKKWQENPQYYLDNPCDTQLLKSIYDKTLEKGLSVEIDNSELLRQWQLPKRKTRLNALWAHLIEGVSSSLDMTSQKILEHILSQGNLSQRILSACNNNYERKTLKKVYTKLSQCLLANQTLG